MRIVSLAEVKARLSFFIEQAKIGGPVVITRNGKAVAVLVTPVDDEDLENILLTRSPRFQGMLEQSRESLRAGKGLTEDQFWSTVDQSQ